MAGIEPLKRIDGGRARWRVQGGALAFLMLLIAGGPARAVERVVSLNLCSDQLLVMLAPEKVAALTVLARDPSLSVVAAEARHLPVVRADAEAVLRLRPDLVLAGAVRGADHGGAAAGVRGCRC